MNKKKKTTNDTELKNEVINTSKRLGIDKNDLFTAIGIETAGTFSPSIKNPKSSATGLIQFTESTAKSMGTTTKAMAKMSSTEQMVFVEKYLLSRGVKPGDGIENIYMAIAQPAHRNKPDDFVIARKGDQVFKVNKGWRDGDEITAGSIRRFAKRHIGKYNSI